MSTDNTPESWEDEFDTHTIKPILQKNIRNLLEGIRVSQKVIENYKRDFDIIPKSDDEKKQKLLTAEKELADMRSLVNRLALQYKRLA